MFVNKYEKYIAAMCGGDSKSSSAFKYLPKTCFLLDLGILRVGGMGAAPYYGPAPYIDTKDISEDKQYIYIYIVAHTT